MPPPAQEEQPAPAAAPDTVAMQLRIGAEREPVRRLDLFCYSAKGTQPLELHVRLDSLPGTLVLSVPEGDKTVVCIANSPFAFNLNALGRFDAMRQLSCSYSDDDPSAPVQGGWAELPDSGGEIFLKPLLCRIELVSVANTMDGYELLEEPRVRLRDIPDSAPILQEAGFRPVELIDAGPWVALPNEVGYFPQKPGTLLWCYPNDTPEDVLGVPRPTLELSCKIRGKNCSYEVPLPPLSRGASVEVEITVDGPGSFSFKLR